ncbi:MAG: efflux RND transporter periplasmic adaptor subunit [Raineya sp.]|jgi:membrane fusion protein (multidrug efflux system)|nr:efflux RND transporter periplasmic adaptor subunit [Raineya sp.]
MKNIIFGVFLLCLYSCASHKDAKQSNTQDKFIITSPMVIDTTFLQEYIADIQSIKNVEVRAKVKGFLERIYVDEGQSVQEGQILFSVGNSGLREELLKANAQLKSAQAEAKIAEVELKNTQLLLEKRVVSSSELEMAKAKLEAIQAKIEEAQSNITNAQLNLSFTTIRAPFSGKINRIPLKVGSLLEEGSLLTTISDNSAVFAYFNISEKEYLNFISKNDLSKIPQVNLIMANGVLFSQKGIVETMESEIDKSTGNLAFRAKFINPEGVLKHGSTGKITIPQKLQKALLIPQQSTFEVQENLYVYVVSANNTIQSRKIIIQMRLGTMYVVSAGLSSSDKILYEGVQLVKEGEIVQTQFKPMMDLVHISKIQ